MKRTAMKRTALTRLVSQARRDPKFLHALVFSPKKASRQIAYLDRDTKEVLAANNPKDTIAMICGESSVAEKSLDYDP